MTLALWMTQLSTVISVIPHFGSCFLAANVINSVFAGDMSVSDDWGIPQDSCLLMLHHSFRLMLIPALCFHFDAKVPAYVQVQLGSYLVVPVKVLISC